jgi:long-chain acyl-CoA synthetase
MVRRTFDLLERYKTYYPDKTDALAGKQNGTWMRYSTHDYIEYANRVSYGLLAMGFKPGDKIATVSNNRPEWNIVDLGMAQVGMIHIPIYPTISFDDYAYIFRHAEPKVLLISDKMLLEKLRPIFEKSPAIEKVFTFNQIDKAAHWSEITDLGKESAEKYIDQVEEIKARIEPEALATIIYTSGTTGVPKGVMLSHTNLVSNFIATTKVHSLGAEHRALSFLPLCHIYERSVNYNFQYKGISIYYAENLGTIIDNIKEIKPHIFNTVPRLLERIYDGIIGKGKALPLFQKSIFFWAVNLGLQYERERANGWFYHLWLTVADKLVYNQWRLALGGNVSIVVCGGAALQTRLNRLFTAAGIEIIEGYGLTETSPVIAVNRPLSREIKIGTVGPFLEGFEVKIAGDGEILCKGPSLMMGYYKAPDLTASVIDEEGWFHTGDVGVLVGNKYLKITDRKKEIFKLSSGKYVAPQPIENRCKESVFIEQVMIIGENEKFASALVSPNFPFLHNWSARHAVNFRDNSDLIRNPRVVTRFQREISHINKSLGQTEQIKRFRLVDDEWSQNTGELSPTLKLKRKYIADKYPDLIDEIYASRNDDVL